MPKCSDVAAAATFRLPHAEEGEGPWTVAFRADLPGVGAVYIKNLKNASVTVDGGFKNYLFMRDCYGAPVETFSVRECKGTSAVAACASRLLLLASPRICSPPPSRRRRAYPWPAS